MAIDYARDLFAFPGRPDDVSSHGCNNLIKTNSAQLIDCADDLIRAMQWQTTNDSKSSNPQTTMVEMLADDLTDRQKTILTKLQEAEDGMHINLLVMETQEAYGDVSSDLTMLELQGLVRSLPGGIYRFVR